MTRFSLSMAILACSLTTSSVAAPGDVHYRVTQIAGGTPVQAGDINDRGEVVGSVGDFFDSRAFLWDGRFIDLGPRIDPAAARAFASGNNNRSDIVGAFTDAAGVNRGFLLRRGVERVPVEVFPGASIGIADINNRRQVIGVTTDASGQERGFVWQRGEAMLFDPLPVHQGRLRVAEINDRGVVVGTSGRQIDEFDSEQAVVWKDGAVVPIAPQTFGPDDEPANSQGIAINNRGQAIGELGARFSGGGYSFVWQDGQLIELPALDGLDPAVNVVFDINNRGVIVGETNLRSGDLAATLWQDGSVVNLNDLVDPGDPLRPFVTLRIGVAINDKGEIVAQGHDSRAEPLRFDLYLLQPVR